jgi:hypothetical protein
MKAVGVKKYGSIEELKAVELPKPDKPQGYDLLIRYECCAIDHPPYARLIDDLELRLPLSIQLTSRYERANMTMLLVRAHDCSITFERSGFLT